MPKIIENIREKITEVGKNILLEKGYKELNIRDIAKECGIGVGTFYNYFKDKEELITKIFMNDWNKILNTIDAVIYSDMNLKDKLFIIYRGVDKFLGDYMVVFYQLTMIKDGHKQSKQHMELLFTKVEEILKFHKDKGEVKNNLDINKLAMLLVSNIISICRQPYITFDELYSSLNI